jgi:UDP-N-acetylmuramyl tripeptide synthase
MARQAGQRVGYCCTDGVVIDGAQIEAGDFSGPAGARAALRQPNIDFAVLEVARGGILRRGLALERAQVALLTNVSPEHFGEYGIDSIEDLAEVKLVLAQALGPKGTLVLNADDALLLEFANRAASQLTCQIALFALDYAHPALQAQRARGAACCGVQNGHLLLYWGQQEYDLGLVVAMPLTVGGSAGYNIANCAGAALSAVAAGIAIADIAQVLVQFGASRHDNPGRLERWDLPDLTVLMDYAHNPEGLAGLMTVAQSLLQQRQQNAESAVAGRIGLLLGQAGNRSNEAIADLAQAAASFAPAHIVLKDITGYMRGRMAGEVPQLLQAQLLVCGMDASQIELILPEVEAAQALLRWAKAGDVLVLPVHDQSSKQAMQATLDALQASGWHAGQTLPALVAEEYSQGNTP